ncbi:MAG TPA: sigma-70 family RNA polymerase sigma factor [Terriglobales bacterium]|nr:sigma-70 family RNA polymerase sigma factor [Terriglobales bacterium]
MAALRAGDEGAMAALYDRYSSVVYGVALRVLRDSAAAEDVLQDIFLQLWRNPGMFDARRGALGAWLAVVARHRSIDALRKQRPADELPETVAVNMDLEHGAARRRVVEKIRAILQNVPQAQRSALEMAFFEGMTHSEIAEKTGEPLGTVKTRIRTALITLRKAFAE